MLLLVRGFLVLVFVVTASCADGDLDNETIAKQGPIVACESSLPKNGDRCDTTKVAAEAYCRLGSCRTKCEEECFCRSTGRWECFLYCRDELGCGTTPLCGVDCTDAAVPPKDTAPPPMDTAVDDTSTD